MTILYSSRAEIIKHWKSAFEPNEIEVCKNEKELLACIKKHNSSVVLLVEVRQYNEIDGFLSLLQEDYPQVKTIVLSNKPNYVEGSTLLKFGIKAYANTYMAQTHLKEALKTVKAGDIWLYPEFIQIMIQELPKQKIALHVKNALLEKLSHKEKEIALLIKDGLRNKEISLVTGITERTVKAHLSAIFEKTGVKDRLALALCI